MAEARSVTTFVMENRLPWPEDGAGAEFNGPFDAGVVYHADQRRDCSIRRISPLGVTLRGDVAKTLGEEVAIELANGQRPAGTVDWVSAGEAGVIFKQPVDMLALINRQLVAQPAERRAMPRVELRSRLHVKWCGNLAPATLRNISAGGLQVEGEDLPPHGTFISVYIEGLNVPAGEVVWRKDNLAGIELMEELSWSSIIPWIREVSRQEIR
jgi:PilZ domain-containing protein